MSRLPPQLHQPTQNQFNLGDFFSGRGEDPLPFIHSHAPLVKVVGKPHASECVLSCFTRRSDLIEVGNGNKSQCSMNEYGGEGGVLIFCYRDRLKGGP